MTAPPADAIVGRLLAPTTAAAPTRVVVVNFEPGAVGLLAALQRLVGADRLELTCVGPAAEAAVRPALAPFGPRARYVEGAVEDGLDAFAARLADLAAIAAADSAIVLPRRGAQEVDATSRLTCAAIRRACGALRGPAVVVAIEDPEASFEFAGLGVATVFYPGFLRAALFAHASVDLAVYGFVRGLLHGRLRARALPIPAELRAGTFRAATLALERGPDGRPITLIGVYEGAGAGAGMRLNPGPGTPLADVACLVALTSDDGGARA